MTLVISKRSRNELSPMSLTVTALVCSQGVSPFLGTLLHTVSRGGGLCSTCTMHSLYFSALQRKKKKPRSPVLPDLLCSTFCGRGGGAKLDYWKNSRNFSFKTFYTHIFIYMYIYVYVSILRSSMFVNFIFRKKSNLKNISIFHVFLKKQ
jgi:hypothetical protein